MTKGTKSDKAAALELYRSLPDLFQEAYDNQNNDEKAEALAADVHAILKAFCGDEEPDTKTIIAMTGVTLVYLDHFFKDLGDPDAVLEVRALRAVWKMGDALDMLLTIFFNLGYEIAKFEDETEK